MLLYNICIGRSMMKSWYSPFSIVEEVRRVRRAQLSVFPSNLDTLITFYREVILHFSTRTLNQGLFFTTEKQPRLFSHLHSKGRR